MKLLALVGIVSLVSCSFAEDGSSGAAPGLDPTKLVSQAQIRYEHSNLRFGESQRRLRFIVDVPVRDISLRFEAPLVASTLGTGSNSFKQGDVLIKASKILVLTPKYGAFVDAEVTFDTAASNARGTGKTVVSSSVGYASFQPFGIIAPTYKHSLSVAGRGSRSKVNTGTIDLYFVPYLKQKSLFTTVDLGFVFDFENSRNFQYVKWTAGSRVGSMGKAIIQAGVQPAVYFGGDRPANTSVEVFVKLVGF